MSTIANAKVEHNYNRYNGYFFGCLQSNLHNHINFILVEFQPVTMNFPSELSVG